MSTGTNNTPRIIRGTPPKKKFTAHTYKKAKPHLLRDFQKRCAYSQQHAERSLGERTMEIDHFNPTLQGAERHRYSNLFLATRHCNGSKSNIWPAKSWRKQGIYLIDPCKESDYGWHIFEHPETHRLVGATPAGRFQISACDLNAAHLVQERWERAEIWRLIEQTPISLKSNSAASFPSETLSVLRAQAEKMIPSIPYLPKTHPGYDEDLRLNKALQASEL